MLKQTLKLTVLSLASLGARLGTSSIIVVGIGGVVAVLVGLLAMANGFRAALEDTGRPDRALVLRTGANDEISSWLTTDEAAIISQLDGVETASPELYVVTDLVTRSTGRPGVAIARGVSDTAFALRPELTMVDGHRFRPGRDELIAGVDAAATYAGLALGESVRVRDHVWKVVGHFRGAGAQDSEVWIDLPGAQAAFRRTGAVNSVRLRLDGPEAAGPLARRIEADPRLQANLIPETRFYRLQSRQRSQLIESFAYLVAGIMAVGAIIAAYSTMHTAVGMRTVEIATFRALGFRSLPVVASLLLEALALALVGGLLGGALVYLLYDGHGATTMDNASLSSVAFEFAVTPRLVAAGMGCALLLGLLGGLVPALAAARAGIAQALRGG